MATRPITDQEIENITSRMNLRDATLVLLGSKTGFRISELLSIRIDDLKEHNGAFKSSITVSKRNMKGKHASRTVPLPESIITLLKAYIANLPKQEFLFTSRNGSRLSRTQAWRMMSDAVKEAGLTGCVAHHSLRKSLGMKAYKESGNDLALTQKILGHKSVNSTISYLQVTSEQVNDLFKRIQ